MKEKKPLQNILEQRKTQQNSLFLSPVTDNEINKIIASLKNTISVEFLKISHPNT